MSALNFDNVFNKENGDVGDLFQSFVYEILRKEDYPKLHKFQTAGKDGGIDLIQQLNNERTVVECKYIGNNSIDEAKNRWKKVRNLLETNLTTSPPKEKQYKPWLSTAKPITFYLFCVSSVISNQSGFDDFEEEIAGFFKRLAASHSHLSHLKNVQVKIFDRSKLLQKLDDFPRLKFKWFPLAEKHGFFLIEKKPKTESFRSFLEEDSLPFYNRLRHLESHPNTNIQNEDQLLETLEDQHGLIITGSGGSGKTRLTLELGRLAKEKGWLVFRCSETIGVENLVKLAELTEDHSKVLLLMDYVETQKHFTQITERLQEINDNFDFNIKYVANCRTSFYPTIRHSPHFHVSLTSHNVYQNSSDSIWLEQYQAAVVRHILNEGGIEIEERHLTVCKNSPILAVFLLYLHRKNRDEELKNLLQEADFGKWIQKRTKMSFVSVSDFEKKLAKLAALLPFPGHLLNPLDDIYSKLLGILANDGWIEKFQDEEWRSVHDVFADRIILSYVQDNPHFIESFIRDIFSFSYAMDCLKSAVVSVQRLSPYLDVDFNKILNAEIDKNLIQWKKIRNYLLETSLLKEDQKLDLLSKETLWEDAEIDIAFRIGLGTIIRQTVNDSNSFTELQLSNAKSWLKKSLPFISSNNFLLVWGLKFLPEDIKDLALERIKAYPYDFHTYRVISTWLDTHLPPTEIQDYLQSWLIQHQTSLDAGFVYCSWLDAGGDVEIIRKQIKSWLIQYQTSLVARFVYNSWLDAAGDVEFIRNPIENWFNQHQTSPAAGFVYFSWLDATRDFEFVRDSVKGWLTQYQVTLPADWVMRAWLEAGGDFAHIKIFAINWVAEHHDNEEAVYLIKRLAKQKDIPLETVRHILLWCTNFYDYEADDALWRLSYLGDKLLNKEISEQFILAAEKTIKFVLLKDKIAYIMQGQITAILFTLFQNSGLEDSKSVERIEYLLLAWIKHPNSFGKGFTTFLPFQRNVFLEHFAVLLENKLLDINDNRTSIERFLRHFNNWLPKYRQDMKPIIQVLQHKYPSDLWGIITYE